MTLPRVALRLQAKWLLVISAIFSLSVGLSNTFVNVYLWKVDKSYAAIGWYNCAVYTTIPLAFIVAGWIAKKLHTVWTLRGGVVLHAAFYVIALVGGASVARVPVLLGLFMGLAAGFYWFSFNQLSLQFTDSGSRDRFYGMNGVMGAVAGMLAPPVAGYLIAAEDRFGGLSGYHMIFALSLALFVVAVLVSVKLRGLHSGGILALASAFREFHTRPWRMILLGCMVYGLREGVFLFLIGLLIFIATGSELKLGEFVLLQSALSFVSFYVVSRLAKVGNRIIVMGIGAACMAAAALIFLLPVTAANIVWYGAAVSLALPFFLVALQGFVFDGISNLRTGQEYHMEHIIFREVFENIGRVLGIVGFIALVSLRPTSRAISTFALCLGFVQLGTWILIAIGQRRSAESGGRADRIEAAPSSSTRKRGARA